MTFNALRHRALWGFNDRSHGTNPDCRLDNPKQAIIKGFIFQERSNLAILRLLLSKAQARKD